MLSGSAFAPMTRYGSRGVEEGSMSGFLLLFEDMRRHTPSASVGWAAAEEVVVVLGLPLLGCLGCLGERGERRVRAFMEARFVCDVDLTMFSFSACMPRMCRHPIGSAASRGGVGGISPVVRTRHSTPAQSSFSAVMDDILKISRSCDAVGVSG